MTGAPSGSSTGVKLFIDNLAVTRGDTVLDIGFGTGLYLPLHREKVGPTGTIIGVDASRQMLQIAKGHTS